MLNAADTTRENQRTATTAHLQWIVDRVGSESRKHFLKEPRLLNIFFLFLRSDDLAAIVRSHTDATQRLGDLAF